MVVATLGICGVSAAEATGSGLNLPSSLHGYLIITDGTDIYNVARDGRTITVSAPTTNQSTNTRAAFWPASQPPAKNETVCDTWSSETRDSNQEGILLRANSQQGIFVEKNIWEGGYWNFVIESYSLSSGSFIELAGFNLSNTFDKGGVVRSFPWSMCARAIGSTISFIVRPSSQPKPSWTNSNYGGSVYIPGNSWTYPGNYGWYAAHLSPGDNLTYSDTVMSP
jgi:hypothetical protein